MGQTLRRNSKNPRRDRFAPSWELRRKTTWLLRLSCSTLTKSVPLTVHQTTSHRNWDLRIVRKYFQSESKCKSTSLSKWRKGERKGDSGKCQLSTQTSAPNYIAETFKRGSGREKFQSGERQKGKAGLVVLDWEQLAPAESPATFCIPEQTTLDLGPSPWGLKTLKTEQETCLRPHAFKSWGCQLQKQQQC